MVVMNVLPATNRQIFATKTCFAQIKHALLTASQMIQTTNALIIGKPVQQDSLVGNVKAKTVAKTVLKIVQTARIFQFTMPFATLLLPCALHAQIL
jgi:hypothetical protein